VGEEDYGGSSMEMKNVSWIRKCCQVLLWEIRSKMIDIQ
jgi:hypothetical protein